MRPGRTQPATLTRRALGTRLAGAFAAIGFGRGAMAQGAASPVAVLDPDLRDAALRGLALAGYRGDPVTAVAAKAALARLAQTDPEAALLGRIYPLLDVRPAAYWPDEVPEAAAADLATLHGAIRATQPVAFRYTDLAGSLSTRTVLPLALVHPPQGRGSSCWPGARSMKPSARSLSAPCRAFARSRAILARSAWPCWQGFWTRKPGGADGTARVAALDQCARPRRLPLGQAQFQAKGRRTGWRKAATTRIARCNSPSLQRAAVTFAATASRQAPAICRAFWTSTSACRIEA